RRLRPFPTRRSSDLFEVDGSGSTLTRQVGRRNHQCMLSVGQVIVREAFKGSAVIFKLAYLPYLRSIQGQRNCANLDVVLNLEFNVYRCDIFLHTDECTLSGVGDRYGGRGYVITGWHVR